MHDFRENSVSSTDNNYWVPYSIWEALYLLSSRSMWLSLCLCLIVCMCIVCIYTHGTYFAFNLTHTYLKLIQFHPRSISMPHNTHTMWMHSYECSEYTHAYNIYNILNFKWIIKISNGCGCHYLLKRGIRRYEPECNALSKHRSISIISPSVPFIQKCIE